MRAFPRLLRQRARPASEIADEEPRGEPRPEFIEAPALRWINIDKPRLASIFGMNVIFPGESSPQAFWVILVAMLLILVGMIAFFRRRGWL
jgi:CorA-like Mg2+ transporter protein